MKRHSKSLTKKSKLHQVTPIGNGQFFVKSGSSGKDYIVRDHGEHNLSCACNWALYHKYDACSHVLAVESWLAQAENKTLSFWDTTADAKRQHRHTEKISEGLWSTSRNNNVSSAPKPITYCVARGVSCYIKKGNGPTQKHVTTKKSTFKKSFECEQGFMSFALGEWTLFVEGFNVSIV